eukprot:COSAG02_NODE_19658_length_871_cov_0.678756_1_plen_75_part_10
MQRELEGGKIRIALSSSRRCTTVTEGRRSVKLPSRAVAPACTASQQRHCHHKEARPTMHAVPNMGHYVVLNFDPA